MSTPASVLVRVRLPDRPGALGQVASRIGAVRGDIVRIDVLEHGGGEAVDEFAVHLADLTLVPVLVREISEVDGADVESVREVAEMPDAPLDALSSIATLCEAGTTAELASRLCAYARRELQADWCSLTLDGQVLAADGTVATSAAGVAESGLAAVAGLLQVGRTAPFHPREQAHLDAIGRLGGSVWQLVEGQG